MIEPGEDPAAAAARELKEEMGYEVREMIPLGSYVVDANRGAGVANLFLGCGARFTGNVDSDDLEEMHVVRMGAAELEQAMMAGEFKQLAWCTCVSLGLIAWKQRAGP